MHAEATNHRWRQRLKDELEKIASDPTSSRVWTFDMEDKFELESGLLTDFPRFQAALEYLWQTVRLQFEAADSDALQAQKHRRRTAWLAIWPGISAILLAILQLLFARLLPQWTALITVLEILSVILAGVAVAMGTRLSFHHQWLCQRQIAERLRSLKFESLGWHLLWCDFRAWKKEVDKKIVEIKSLTPHEADNWATATGAVASQPARDPECPADPPELIALADYYLFKRVGFQQAYFDRQAKKADSQSWSTRRKVSLWIFVLSVIIVLVHGIMALIGMFILHADQTSHQAEHVSLFHLTEMILVAMAAILPIIGFGLRAWISAFEFPRSRNLFQAKSRALSWSIRAIEHDKGDLIKTMNHIHEAEHFFRGEHREWYRLQMESEWYV